VLAAARELCWGLWCVSGEMEAWRARARCIPDAPIRLDALDAIARKRTHADGAALFSILPARRHGGLLALLVAYQTAWDFLDGVSERGAGVGVHNGQHLHRALVEALDPHRPVCSHYRHHPHRDDGGYMRALIAACRAACSQLPGYELVRPLVLAEATRCAIQSLNHELDDEQRERALRAWAAAGGTEGGDGLAGAEDVPEPSGAEVVYELSGAESMHGLAWFELTAAASASLVPHVLLALAAEPRCELADVAAACAAYLPWASLATTMLDSYTDRREDAQSGAHSYIAHYDDSEQAIRRVEEIVDRAMRAAGSLRGGRRHAVIVGCIVAMYLSKDSTRAADTRAVTHTLVHAGGSLVRVLLPILRAWRIAYGQRAA
jgi:tetraprenyl-beta-curcumene synthase